MRQEYLLLPLLLFSLFSCGDNADEATDVWIGGEIVNPKYGYVLLMKDREIIDTMRLDDNNFFMYHIDSVAEGLYSFHHGEYQVMHLSPGDSLMLRVNTTEFDESLSYSGGGARKNNLLIDFFLQNERENQMMPELYMLSPEAFETKIDSLTNERQKFFEVYLKKDEPSESFKSIINANILYDEYSKRELYIARHSRKTSNTELQEIPASFYEHRGDIDYNNASLKNYYSYFRFLNRLFDNMAYDRYKEEQGYDRYSYVHTKHKLAIIDSLVESDLLKNNISRTNTQRFLLRAGDQKEVDEIYALFASMNKDPEDVAEIQSLKTSIENLMPSKRIPNIKLVTEANTVKDLHTLITKPSVLFFWTSESAQHNENIHTKAAELREKYPEYQFIGINTDTHFRKWRSIVRALGYNTSLEFQIEDIENARQALVLSSISKSLIVDRNGDILEHYTNLFHPDLESKLLGYLNQ
ncbi:TlpA family protein disulfide reductase [Altibacter sp. HG106]|uniref:TlpA family protein disulfide reductase n=1 Tax=Altibacter sp. HG106 TaxID=3023937 RepID=UPI002350534C|nr:thioredoxin-like domain-containing protein [Altibacter sp. HG106]MDC7993884.1 hypothetical protein [Altibacter sp. HG106]